MLEKPGVDLSFVGSKVPLPTVEVDCDSIPKNRGLDDLVANALKPFASANPLARATVYVYLGESIYFLERTYSAFFGVAGSKKILILEGILRALRKTPEIRARFSDYILAAKGERKFHVQDGVVWRPVDALTWYASNKEEVDRGEGLGTDDSNSLREETTNESPLEGDSSAITRAPDAARFRRARADASIGSIRSAAEEIFGLPEGSVALCGPDGKPMRSDAKIATLRKRWE